jgi:hypothetical protein
VVCGGLPVGREAGSHEACVPGSFDPDPTHQLVPVGDLVRDLKTLKPHPRMVYAAVFAGAPAPVDVDLDVNQCANLAPSGCGTADTVFGGCADPGIRLAAFTRGFDADRGRFYDITATLADEAFGQIGLDLATALRGD